MSMYNRQPISREEVGPLLVQPVTAASVAITTSTSVRTSGYSFRVPLVVTDPTAAFVAEGAELPVSDAVLGEVTVVPAKVAGLTIISRELADDSDPAAAQVIGDGLSRDIARRIDAAFYGAMPLPAPSGLGALSGVQTVSAPFSNLDPFAEAVSKAETVGAALTAFVTSPATALALAKIKSGSGSNAPLLGADPTEPGVRRILGVPLYVSPAVAANTIWGYDVTRVWTIIRDDATIEADRSIFFTSDRVAVRGTMRIGYAFGHPASVIKLTATP